jgi:hypothetical protein
MVFGCDELQHRSRDYLRVPRAVADCVQRVVESRGLDVFHGAFARRTYWTLELVVWLQLSHRDIRGFTLRFRQMISMPPVRSSSARCLPHACCSENAWWTSRYNTHRTCRTRIACEEQSSRIRTIGGKYPPVNWQPCSTTRRVSLIGTCSSTARRIFCSSSARVIVCCFHQTPLCPPVPCGRPCLALQTGTIDGILFSCVRR